MDSKSKYAIIGAIIAAAVVAGVVGFMAVSNTPEQSTATNTPSQKMETGTLTVYSGRAENLVGPIIEKFEKETGIDVQVKYGNTAELALAIIEEGRNSPADVYFAQDAGALGALSKEGRLLKISSPILQKVDPAYRSQNGDWVGISGRARVVDYNVNLVDKSQLPDSIWDFTDPKWKGKIGWAPSNGSFQSFVTALRVLEGEDRARQWLLGIMANEPIVYSGNSPIVEALGRGEIHVGFVNNYYLQRYTTKDASFPVAHHYTKGDAGSMINIAGAAIVDTTKNKALAERFIQYLLSEDAQTYFATSTYEYPLIKGIPVAASQIPIEQIKKPAIDLNKLDDLQGTLNLLKDIRAL
jgi:iron(III) transport system substrate-binding protein